MKKGTKAARKSRVNELEGMSLEQLMEAPRHDLQSIVLRQRVRHTLQQVVEEEFNLWAASFQGETTEQGRARIVRNGYHQQREVGTVMGLLPVRVPRVKDRKGDESFHSIIVPPYLRRATEISELLPCLYLQGISSGNFSETFSRLMGRQVTISASTITRLKSIWGQERLVWLKRDLSAKKYVYWWADGIYYNVRLLGERRCLLVIIGATVTGQKELVGLYTGHRESSISWKELLHQLQRQGVKYGPQLAIGDGAMGFWSALQEVYPDTREQRCWVHKTVNVLDKLPKSVQADGKKHLHEICYAPTRKAAETAIRDFCRVFGDRYPKAVACLVASQEELLAFYNFPAGHWRHIRSTNIIESPFAGIRLRTYKTKGAGSATAAELMVFKLLGAAEKRWHKLNRVSFLKLVLQKEKFVDGERVKSKPAAALAPPAKKNGLKKVA